MARAAWASLPFALGPALGEALAGWSADVRSTATVGLWAIWAVTMIATLVPHPIALTAWRIAGPTPAVAAVIAAVSGHASVLGDAAAIAAAALAFATPVGMTAVNGPAYPNERRYPLRPPAITVVGPALVSWVVVVGGPVVAVLLLADHRWVVGTAVAVIGSLLSALGGRALHGLSRRWLVFVPAGIVLHDPLTLADPVLFQRAVITSVGPAPAEPDGDRLDLTAGAAGLAVSIRLTEPTGVFAITKPGRRPTAETVSTTELVLTPTRAASVLADAMERGYLVG